MTEKRFTTDNGSNEDVCLVDNLTKKEYESNFNDIVDLMNKLWGQTQRFEKHNKYLREENEQLKQSYAQLKQKHQYNNEYIADVCADCERLEKENEQLKSQLKEIAYYFRDGVTRNDLDDKDFEDLKRLVRE